VLAAGLNKGGQGVYALDITSPGSVVNTDASADSLFMWEFTDAQSAELGFTYSRPIITRMRNGQWVAIFGNGYNNTDTRDGTDTHVSATGNAVLYIVDLATGALVVPPIDTGVGMAEDPLAQSRPNGLATPNVVDINGDSIADYAYAGDLFGNLWKFDLSSNNPSDWGLMYGEPLFKAVNSDGRPQPITEKPTAEFGPNGVGLVVLFGTGKFLESIDRDIGSAIKQSFYGIYDANTGTASDVVSGRGDLVQQTILGETTTTFNGAPIGVRVTSDNIVDPVAKDGWFIDLVSPSGFQGEMQVTDPVLRNGRVIFTTLIPDTDVCAYGGRSWLMEMDAISGSRLSYSPFDFNDDKSFNETDYITVTVGATTLTVPASGFSQGQILAQPRLLAGENQDFGIVPGSGSQEPPPLPGFSPGPGATGRQSWRQLR
jgi:type IV pilus assembly protein PilY1